MTSRATSSFEITEWTEDPRVDEELLKVTRTRIGKAFSGDLEGTSVGEMVMAGAQEGSMAYVGFDHVVGSLDGRKGSFLLQHVATMSRAGGSADWTIVADSGTGELTGLSGRAEISAADDGSHTITIDYVLRDDASESPASDAPPA